MYGPPDTMKRLAARFAYIFDDSIKPLPGTSKPEGRAHPVRAGESFRVGDVDVLPVAVPHGPISVYGYRIGKLGYITDAKELPEEAVRAFRGVSVLVLNALFRTPHPTHLSVSEAVAAAQKVGARQTWLTHLTHRTSHAELEAELPRGIAPAFDGLTVQID
jgi:phosphoribosyl 1,2-cyclic phosphate phosphodiesterase